ncbi:MAG: tetratricopeptide repeat protein [Planctomycetes bacterium]|nr:tetratricopeptide repeat protein [Planctomycetota bacterium]
MQVEAHAAADEKARLRPWLVYAVLVAVTVAAYWSSFDGVFHWDDEDDLLRNPFIRDFATAWNAPSQGGLAGRPVASYTFALNYALGGYATFGWHLVNLAIHSSAVCLVFAILRRTFSSASFDASVRSRAVWLAAFVALLWAVHPLQTQSVTYFVQRVESLMGLFVLATLYAAIRAFDGPRSFAWSLACVGACWLAVGTKEVAVVAPFLVWIYDRTFAAGSFAEAWKRRRGLYLGLASSWILLACLVVASEGRSESVDVGVAGVWAYLRVQAFALATYVKLAVVPYPLIFDYGVRIQVAPWVWASAGAAIVAALVFTVVAVVRGRPIGFALAWFFLILAPTSSVLPIVTEFVAEHRMYLPLAGLLAIAVVFVGARVKLPSSLAAAFGVCVVIAFGALTFARNRDYHDPDGMWADVVAKCPTNDRAQNNFGNCLRAKGDLDGAFEHYAKACELAPDDANWRTNLGAIRLERGDVAGALVDLERAVAADPSHALARTLRAKAFGLSGEVDRATADFRAVLAAAPDYGPALKELALLLLANDRAREAVPYFQSALAIAPGDPDVLWGLAWICATAPEDDLRSPENALMLLQRLVAAQRGPRPRDLMLTAAALMELGRSKEALPTAELAVERIRSSGKAARVETLTRALELFRAGKLLRSDPELARALR